MKKRLLVMLLLLCLLLTALTATATAAYTGASGLLDCTLDGRTFHFSINGRYRCESNHTTSVLYADDHKLLSVEAKKSDGTVVPIAEWRPGDKILAKVEIPNFNCSRCIEDGGLCGSMNKTINATIEFTGDDFCHRWRNSNNPLTTRMDHIRGANTNDYIDFNLYCYDTSLYQLRHHDAGKPTCEEDGYDTEWYRCPLCGKTFSDNRGANEITVNLRLGHDFDANGVCRRTDCNYHAEAYIYTSPTQPKKYYDTVANAISNAAAPAESVHVVSYERDTPIIINKIVYLIVENGVTVPEIRMESCSGGNSGYFVNINNFGTVGLFSSSDTVTNQYSGIFYTNHNRTERITAASTAAQIMQISNITDGTIDEINIPQTANPTPKVQVTNNGGTITTLSGSPKNVALCTGTGSYGTITSTSGTIDQLLNTGCYFYFPDGKKWVNSNAGSTVSNVIVSFAPFTVKVNRDGSALTATNGGYTVDGVEVGTDVALSAAFTLNPTNSGLTVSESEITSRWYYKGESENASENNTLTLKDIQYGVYDLIFEAKESTYGFTTSVNVKVNVNPPEGRKTVISLKKQPTLDSYTKVYNGTKDASAVLPPIEFQLADGREIRISPDCYTPKMEYYSPDCIKNNWIIVEVTLTEEGKTYYDLTNGKIEVPATITRYDGSEVFLAGANTDALKNDHPCIGKPVLKYLELQARLFDSEGNRSNTTELMPGDASEDRFQYSFYHLRPGATEPDPELDELVTADSVFTYPEEGYYFYAVVEPSLNYTGCITNSTAYFHVYDKYNGNSHTHDKKTYTDWNGSSSSIATGGTATRYLSGAQPNANVDLALSQNKTLDLCLYNKAVHVIGSSYDQIYLVGGSTLVLSDCSKTGKVIGSAVASGFGGVAYVKNGTLSVYDVTLTGGIAKSGGAIVVDEKGVLNIHSGEISGNYVTGGKGGAIYIKSGGVVNMYGGTIRNNHAYSGSGGAVYVEAGGTLNLYGGEISGNTASGLGGGIYVEAGGKVTIQGSPVVTGNTANGKPSNLYICVSSSPLLTIDAEGLTTDAQIGISTDASCPVLLAGGMQTDYSAYFIPDDTNTFVLYNSDAKTLTLCAKPTATLEGDTLTITTGSGNTFVLLAAEYDTDGKMLAVQSWNVAPQKDTYTCGVKNPGAKIKCFLLRATSYTPILTPFSPLA